MKLINILGFMLNKRAKAGSQQILESLHIKKGDVIADIGSGGGYFTFEFAKRTGKDGKVYSVDTNTGLLNYIEKKQKKQNIKNVITMWADETGFQLSGETCNLIFSRNVFHHIKSAPDYFRSIQRNLNPDGKVAIIEWLPNGAMRTGHTKSEMEICRVMKAAGFKRIQSFNYLDSQSFNIFAPDHT